MDAPEAREQIDILDRILSRAELPVKLSPFPFVVWGIAAAIMNCVVQLVVSEKSPPALLFVAAAALATAVISMILWVRQLQGADRRTLIDRQMAIAFNLAWIVALIAQAGAFHIFSQWAQAAIWSVMYGGALLFAGALVRSRIVFGGGVILLASVVAANFALGIAGFVLALGDLLGMAGAGVLLYTGRR